MKKTRISPDLKIPLVYVLLGGAWILLSDSLLAALVKDASALTQLQTYKGWVFVVLSALVIFLLLRREERLRAAVEKKKEESEVRFRQLFENSMDAILLTSPDGQIHAASPAASILFGWSEEEIIRLGRSGIVDVTDPRLKRALDERAQTGQFHGELTFLRADGSKFDGDISTKIFKSLDGAEYTTLIIRDITERIKAQREILATRDRLQRVLDGINDGFVAFDANLNYTYVNPRGGEMLGRKPEDLVGKNYWEEYPEAKGTPFAEAYVRALETQEPLVIEDHYVPWDRWFENRIHPSEDGLSVFFTEITERKRAEEKLRESEQRFAALFEKSAFVVVLSSLPNGVMLNVNAAFEKVFGFTKGEAVGRTTLDLGINPDAAGRERILAQLQAQGSARDIELELHTKSGEARTFSVNVDLIDIGNEKYILNTMLDITERKRAQERVAFQAFLLENVSDAILATDTQRNIASWNHAAEKMFGWTEEEAKGQPVAEIIRAEFSDEQRSRALNDLAETGQYNAEVRVARKNGETIWVEGVTSALRGADGAIIGYLSVNRDVTERKRAERMIQSERDFSERALNSLPGVFYMYDEDRKFLRWNQNFRTATGYSDEEIAGMNPLDFFAGEEKNLLAERIQEVFATGASAVEADFVSKDGAHTPYYFTGHTVQVGGKPCLIGVGIDISERKRAEQTLQRNEQILRLFVEYSPASIAMFDREMNYIVASKRYAADYELGDQELVGRSHYEVFPEIPERWKEIHRRCLAGAVERAEEDPFPRKDGRTDWVRWEIHPWCQRDGEIGGIILFSEVVTERKRAEQAIQRRTAELTTLYQSSQRLQKLLSTDELSQEIIELLERNLSYEYGAVLLLEDSTGRLIPFAVAGGSREAEFVESDKAYIASHEPRVGRGITGWVAQHAQTVRLGDVQGDKRYYGLRNDIRSEMCAPLLAGERVIGVINVETTEANAYAENDQRVLETVAAHISVAIQNARLLEETRLHRDRLAELSRRLVETRESEARAIGRELHDQFGQILTAMKITLDMAGQLPEEAAKKKIQQAQTFAADLLDRTSRLSLQLRPPMLDDLGLIPALTWQVNRFQEETGIAVKFNHSGVEGVRFAAEIETTAYRVTQESLTNVARHARGTRVRIEVRKRGAEVEIKIEDNGVGFDPQAALALNRGLGGMRERVQLVGGTFDIESEPGRGARKTIRLPWKERA